MAETTKADQASEVQQLRDRIEALEEELKKERSRKHKHAETREELDKSLDEMRDKMNRLSRGLFFAAMEALAVSADMTKQFVDKFEQHNTSERRDTWSKLMTDVPIDASRAFVDALKKGAEDTDKIVDKFYAKYKE